jgi:predicted DNA-binding antitoxin AbrB/MazE fold protein
MEEIVVAVYRNGALYPLEPLDLKESERVRIQVMTEKPAVSDESAAVEALAAAGLISRPPRQSSAPRLSDADRLRLARKLGRGPGKPLSEMIIEDRGDP